MADALKVIKENANAKFNESIDVSINLGIDAKKSDQNVRGAVVLPRGTGKDKRVAVFAQGAKAAEAKAAGVPFVTTGAEPVQVAPGLKIVIVKDPNNLLLELAERGPR